MAAYISSPLRPRLRHVQIRAEGSVEVIVNRMSQSEIRMRRRDLSEVISELAECLAPGSGGSLLRSIDRPTK